MGKLFLQGELYWEDLYIFTVLRFKFMKALLSLLLLLPFVAISQPVMPLIPENFPDAMVGVSATYDIAALPQYNDEAAVFIEFGFMSLMVQEIAWATAKIKVEVYEMGSPDAAFGIYSVSAMKCLQRDTLTSYDCLGPYQYQAAYGNLYISITSETGSAAVRALFLPVANAIMQKNSRPFFKLPDPFNQPLLKNARKTLVFIHGPVGLQNCLFPWQDLFLTVRFGMYALSLMNPRSEMYFARIWFETPSDQLRFLTLAGLTQSGVPVPNTNTNDGLYREYQQVDDQTIYFLQSQEPWPISAILNPRN